MMLCLLAGGSEQQALCVSWSTLCFEYTWPHGKCLSMAGMAAQCSEGFSQSLMTSLRSYLLDTTRTCSTINGFVSVVCISKRKKQTRHPIKNHNFQTDTRLKK
ncbi:unnamed protein product [Ectocarpus sp. 12 AP-2014]